MAGANFVFFWRPREGGGPNGRSVMRAAMRQRCPIACMALAIGKRGQRLRETPASRSRDDMKPYLTPNPCNACGVKIRALLGGHVNGGFSLRNPMAIATVLEIVVRVHHRKRRGSCRRA